MHQQSSTQFQHPMSLNGVNNTQVRNSKIQHWLSACIATSGDVISVRFSCKTSRDCVSEEHDNTTLGQQRWWCIGWICHTRQWQECYQGQHHQSCHSIRDLITVQLAACVTSVIKSNYPDKWPGTAERTVTTNLKSDKHEMWLGSLICL